MGPLIAKFEGKNYILLRFKMQTLLQMKELWGLIDKIEVKLDDYEVATIANYTKKENKARNFLVQSLLDSQLKIFLTKKFFHVIDERY